MSVSNEGTSVKPMRFDDEYSLTSVPSGTSTVTLENDLIEISSSLRRSAINNLANEVKLGLNRRATPSPTFVIVDPWSTGTRLCKEIKSLGFELIIVWLNFQRSTQLSLLATHNFIFGSVNLDGQQDIDEEKRYVNLISTLKELRMQGFDLQNVISGSETGVILAEKLAFTLGLPGNDMKIAKTRRNKYYMGERLREKGMRSVKQLLCKEVEQVQNFLDAWNPNPFLVIVKPNQGAGSDDVYLCKTKEEVLKAFNKINNSINSLGEKNDGVLIQEYLNGKEYVIDSVTRDGKHEIVAIWEYDKREVNKRFNVYFGSYPISITEETEVTKQLKAYCFEMLDALGFVNGPSHAEIKMTTTGPCLVEVGARCHGGNATWLEVAQNFYGRNQISKVIEKFGVIGTREEKEESLTVIPEKQEEYVKKFGVVLDMVSYEEGLIEEVPGEDFVRGCESYSRLDLLKKQGDSLVITVDCNTTPGQIILIHEDENVVRRDYNKIHELMATKDAFFVLKRDM